MAVSQAKLQEDLENFQILDTTQILDGNPKDTGYYIGQSFYNIGGTPKDYYPEAVFDGGEGDNRTILNEEYLKAEADTTKFRPDKFRSGGNGFSVEEYAGLSFNQKFRLYRLVAILKDWGKQVTALRMECTDDDGLFDEAKTKLMQFKEYLVTFKYDRIDEEFDDKSVAPHLFQGAFDKIVEYYREHYSQSNGELDIVTLSFFARHVGNSQYRPKFLHHVILSCSHGYQDNLKHTFKVLYYNFKSPLGTDHEKRHYTRDVMCNMINHYKSILDGTADALQDMDPNVQKTAKDTALNAILYIDKMYERFRVEFSGILITGRSGKMSRSRFVAKDSLGEMVATTGSDNKILKTVKAALRYAPEASQYHTNKSISDLVQEKLSERRHHRGWQAAKTLLRFGAIALVVAFPFLASFKMFGPLHVAAKAAKHAVTSWMQKVGQAFMKHVLHKTASYQATAGIGAGVVAAGGGLSAMLVKWVAMKTKRFKPFWRSRWQRFKEIFKATGGGARNIASRNDADRDFEGIQAGFLEEKQRATNVCTAGVPATAAATPSPGGVSSATPDSLKPSDSDGGAGEVKLDGEGPSDAPVPGRLAISFAAVEDWSPEMGAVPPDQSAPAAPTAPAPAPAPGPV